MAWNTAQTETVIAISSGYEAPYAFTLSFKQRLTQSPTSFRNAHDWGSWLMALEWTAHDAKHKGVRADRPDVTRDRLGYRRDPLTDFM